MKRIAFLWLTFLLCAPLAADPLDPFTFVKQVTQQDGDTIATSQVSVGVCPGTTCPTLISPAVTDKTGRRRRIVNTSAFKVFVGTNTTTLSTTGYVIGESTTTYFFYETYNTAAIYGTAVSTGTVAVMTETNSKP